MRKLILLMNLVMFCYSALADLQPATLVHFKGDVRIFRDPSTSAHSNKGAQVLFEDRYYLVESAKLGLKIQPLDIVTTGVDGKAKLVFANGDSFFVGSGTAYSMSQAASTQTGKAKTSGQELNLIYGKLRALISKTGPRNNLSVKTTSAVAGVRGTDFHIKQLGSNTELTVIRGAVEVAKLNEPGKKEVINQGLTAKVEQVEPPKDGSQPAESKPIAIHQATKPALAEIQMDSTIETKRDLTQVSKAERQEIEKLEKKATESVLTDIKSHNPELLAKIKDKQNVDVAELSTQAVEKLAETAPQGPKKPTLQDVQDVQKNPYDKYFRPIPGK